MNIDDASRERLEHGRFEDAHETGQDHQLHFMLSQERHQFSFAFRFQAGPKWAGVEKKRGHAELPADLENAGVGDIRHDHARFRGKIVLRDLLQDRPAVAPFAGPEETEPKPLHSACNCRTMAVVE